MDVFSLSNSSILRVCGRFFRALHNNPIAFIKTAIRFKYVRRYQGKFSLSEACLICRHGRIVTTIAKF